MIKDGKEKIFTLCIVHKHPRVLLGYKKRGFGQGRWNGFGGKVEGNESVIEAAKRELKEEAGIVVLKIKKAGELSFEFKNNGDKLKVHVFKVNDFSGEEKESEEMRPQWFYIDEIPFKKMWPDDVYWMPLFFSGRSFKGNFIFKDENTLIYKFIEVVKEL